MSNYIAEYAEKTSLAAKIRDLLAPNMGLANLGLWVRPEDGQGNVAIHFTRGPKGEHVITVNTSNKMEAIKRAWAHMNGYIDVAQGR